MRVADLIKQLEHYKPEDELLVSYWDKEWVEVYVDDKTKVDEIFEKVLDDFESIDNDFGDTVCRFISEAQREVK
jgi:hypothetical protein